MAAYDEIKSRLTFLDDVNWATRDKVEQVLIVANDVTGAVLKVYQKLRGDAASQADLQSAVRRLGDELFAPLDIPGVGPVLEAIIKSQLPNLLAGVVPAVDAKLDEVLPNPVPQPE